MPRLPVGKVRAAKESLRGYGGSMARMQPWLLLSTGLQIWSPMLCVRLVNLTRSGPWGFWMKIRRGNVSGRKAGGGDHAAEFKFRQPSPEANDYESARNLQVASQSVSQWAGEDSLVESRWVKSFPVGDTRSWAATKQWVAGLPADERAEVQSTWMGVVRRNGRAAPSPTRPSKPNE